MFGRLRTLFRGFFSLFITGLERANPKVLIEAERENLRRQIARFNEHLASHGGFCERLMRQIKAQKPGLPIVIASAHSMASDRERFLAAGADDVLSKPFKLTDLTGVVDRLAGHKSLP